MSLIISSFDDYILVESKTGMDYWEIMEGMSQLFSRPDFQEKNDIWLFREGHLKMMYGDLYNIKEMVAKLYPPDSKGKKTAIVAQSGVQHSLATLYADLAKDLPREVKVFSDLKSATDWIKS